MKGTKLRASAKNKEQEEGWGKINPLTLLTPGVPRLFARSLALSPHLEDGLETFATLNDITSYKGFLYIRLLTRLTLKYIPSLGRRVNPDCKTNGT